MLCTHTDAADRVREVTLMVRPWSALKAGLADVRPGGATPGASVSRDARPEPTAPPQV